MMYPLQRIWRRDFSSWQEYYFQYQFQLAENYYIPLLGSWDAPIHGQTILDVGCGDGGFTAALAAEGGICTGVETRAFPWQENANLRFFVQDITADDAVDRIGDSYDLIILRDVIEHIPRTAKTDFIRALHRFAHHETRILITFPPFYSPFGLHQQTHLTSILKMMPWLSLLPQGIVNRLARVLGESDDNIADVTEIRDCRMTIAGFLQLAGACHLVVDRQIHFTVRPSHEIRYGWPMTESALGTVPFLREFLIMGTAYLLSRDETTDTA